MTTPQGKPSEHDELGVSSGITVQVKGRIKSSEMFKSKKGNEYYRTLVVKPAKDAYSHPSTFPILSVGRVGKENSDVDIACELRPTSIQGKDGKLYRNVNLWLVE